MRERWWVAPGADAVLASHGLASVPACMARAQEGERLSSDRQSAAVRLPGDPPLFLKWRRPRGWKAWKAWLRPSRERREARGMLRARARGVPALAPLLVGERRRRGWLVGSVLVRPYLEGFVTAESLLPEADEGLVVHLARTLRAWHDLGFRHGDCYPKNVLLRPPRGSAVPIGAPAATFPDPGPRWDRLRARDLAQWSVGLEAVRPGADPTTLLAPYAEGGLLGPADRLRRDVEAFRARILARKAARRASRPRREPRGPPPPVPLGQDEGHVPVEARPLGELGPLVPGPLPRRNG